MMLVAIMSGIWLLSCSYALFRQYRANSRRPVKMTDIFATVVIMGLTLANAYIFMTSVQAL